MIGNDEFWVLVRKFVTEYVKGRKRIKIELRPKMTVQQHMKSIRKKLKKLGLKYVYYVMPDHYRIFLPIEGNDVELIKELFYPRRKKSTKNKIKKKLKKGTPLKIKKRKKHKKRKKSTYTPEEKIQLIKEGKLSLQLKKAKSILTSCISCKHIRRVPEDNQWGCTLFGTRMNIASIYVCPYFEPRQEEKEED